MRGGQKMDLGTAEMEGLVRDHSLSGPEALKQSPFTQLFTECGKC